MQLITCKIVSNVFHIFPVTEFLRFRKMYFPVFGLQQQDVRPPGVCPKAAPIFPYFVRGPWLEPILSSAKL